MRKKRTLEGKAALSEDEIKMLYLSKNYVPVVEKELETIDEAEIEVDATGCTAVEGSGGSGGGGGGGGCPDAGLPRRGAPPPQLPPSARSSRSSSRRTSTTAGAMPEPAAAMAEVRKIQTLPYWMQDKRKDRKRQMMVKIKLCQGKSSRRKWGNLTPELEAALISAIENSGDDDKTDAVPFNGNAGNEEGYLAPDCPAETEVGGDPGDRRHLPDAVQSLGDHRENGTGSDRTRKSKNGGRSRRASSAKAKRPKRERLGLGEGADQDHKTTQSGPTTDPLKENGLSNSKPRQTAAAIQGFDGEDFGDDGLKDVFREAEPIADLVLDDGGQRSEPPISTAFTDEACWDDDEAVQRQIAEADSFFGPIGAFDDDNDDNDDDEGSGEPRQRLSRPPELVQQDFPDEIRAPVNSVVQQVRVRRSSRFFRLRPSKDAAVPADSEDVSDPAPFGTIYQDVVKVVKRSRRSNRLPPLSTVVLQANVPGPDGVLADAAVVEKNKLPAKDGNSPNTLGEDCFVSASPSLAGKLSKEVFTSSPSVPSSPSVGSRRPLCNVGNIVAV